MKMNICFISDRKFLHYAKTMVNSLLQNNASHEICLFLVSDDVTQEEADTAFAPLLTEKATLTLIRVTKEDIGFIETNLRFGHYIFYRLFFYKFFPKDIPVILSLDVDIIIKGDISSIYETKLEEYAFAACLDMKSTCGSIFSIQQLERYGIDPNQNYYNLGVMLLNLEKMRQEDKGELMLKTVMEDTSFEWPEQDLFNIFYKDEIFTLPRRYNHAPFRSFPGNEIGVEPVILHYLGTRKPDCYKYDGEYVRLYWKYVVDRPGKLRMAAYWIKRAVYLGCCPLWRIPINFFYSFKMNLK